jgi:hypothetical protein
VDVVHRGGLVGGGRLPLGRGGERRRPLVGVQRPEPADDPLHVLGGEPLERAEPRPGPLDQQLLDLGEGARLLAVLGGGHPRGAARPRRWPGAAGRLAGHAADDR